MEIPPKAERTREMRNSAEVKRLFEREAVCFGASDGTPEYRAVQLFGAEAVAFARKMSGSNGYGIGSFTAQYLTERGVHIAATYLNVKEIEQEERLHGGPRE